MSRIIKLLRNRDFLLFLAITLGLLWGESARITEPAILPVLTVVMTLSTMGVSGSVFRSPAALIRPALTGLVMNYGILSTVLFGLNALLIRDEAIWAGFVIMMAVPPAVAVIPFSYLLDGDSTLSFIALTGCYLGALILTPLITVGLLGTGFVDRGKLLVVMLELILVPLICSRVLIWTGWANKIDPLKGPITNWSFFVVVYTIIGLNRSMFLERPLSLLPAAMIAVATTFLLGYGIERMGRLFHLEQKMITSLVLLGTQKNTGLAAGLALALFSERTAVPATVTTIFMIVYIIWLSLKKRWAP